MATPGAPLTTNMVDGTELPPYLTIASLNVAGKLYGVVDELIEFINKYNVHLICVQDCGVFRNNYIFDKNNIKVLKQTAPKEDSAGNMAVLAVGAIQHLITADSPPTTTRYGHRIQKLTLLSKTPQEITIYNVYHQSKNTNTNKLILEIPTTGRAILVGDLNSVTNSTLEWKSSNKSQAPLQPATELINQGWTDAFRLCNGTKIKYSRWGSYKNKEGKINLTASKIDHTYVTHPIIDLIKATWIVEEEIISSDHRPNIMQINLKDVPGITSTRPSITYREGIRDKKHWETFQKQVSNSHIPGYQVSSEVAGPILTNIIKTAFEENFPEKTIDLPDPLHHIHNDPEFQNLKHAKHTAYKLIKVCRALISTNGNFTDEHHNMFNTVNKHINTPIPAVVEDCTYVLLKMAETHIGNLKRYRARRLDREKISEKVSQIVDKIDNNGHNVFKLLNNNANYEISCLFNNNEVILGKDKINDALTTSWRKQFATKMKPNIKFKRFLANVPTPNNNIARPKPDFSVEHLKYIIKNKTPTSPGKTGTSWKMLNWTSDEYLARLSNIYIDCYERELKITEWDHGTTVLLSKPGNPTPDNFRPITLLSVEYKLYTQVLTIALTEWLHANHIIPDCQNGATAEKGCDTSLWHYLCTIKDANQFNRELHALYIDFKKAYDSVEHWTLKEIFEHLKLGKIGNVIMSILSNTYTNLKINSEILDEKIWFECGVKQGDTISPILFLMFMTPLLATLEASHIGYLNTRTGIHMNTTAIMDDVLTVTDNVNDIIKAHQIINDFAEATGMQINPTKSAYAWLNAPHIHAKCWRGQF